jgi:hypothetical protein
VGGGAQKGEPVDLSRVGHDCRARWRAGSVGTWRSVEIAVGLLDGGRWYVQLVGQVHARPRAYPNKQAAWQVVQNLMATRPGEQWERVPCYPSEPLRSSSPAKQHRESRGHSDQT